MTSLDIFIDWFKDYYKHEFKELPPKFKNYWIEEILLNNGQYITREMVQSFDGCVKCGQCCINQRCPHIDTLTKLCLRHDNPIDELCKTYPWSGELGIAPLLLNCRYQVSFFINYFDEFFENCIQQEVKIDA